MINVIKAKEGYVFALKDKSEIYDNIIVLGIYDSADNYIQITKEEALKIKAEKEKLEAEKLNRDYNK